ncbi:MAG: histidine phosphotransferase family protein [Alphaproteobacteria bacterium]
MDLITSSARAAADRLQFYRVAFGYSGGSGQSLGALQTLLKPFVADAKCESSWSIDPAVSQSVLSLDAAQIVLNAVALGLDCLPRSGQVRVSLEPAAGERISIRVDVSGPSVRIREEVSRALTVPLGEVEMAVRAIHAILLRMVAARVGSVVALAAAESRVSLSVSSVPIES